MKSRPVAAAFFVVFCLLLCGLILRRQIAAHPLPPERGRSLESNIQNATGFQGWRAASPAEAQQVRTTLQGEMRALDTGDALKAMSFRSSFSPQRSSDPTEFMQRVQEYHPELIHSRQFGSGQVWADKLGQNARASFHILAANGDRVRDDFWLVRENGQFKISHVEAQKLPN